MKGVMIVTETVPGPKTGQATRWCITRHYTFIGTRRCWYYKGSSVLDAIRSWSGPVKFRIKRAK